MWRYKCLPLFQGWHFRTHGQSGSCSWSSCCWTQSPRSCPGRCWCSSRRPSGCSPPLQWVCCCWCPQWSHLSLEIWEMWMMQTLWKLYIMWRWEWGIEESRPDARESVVLRPFLSGNPGQTCSKPWQKLFVHVSYLCLTKECGEEGD